ncbi:MAG: DUF1272 domain-containing protein [Planctomycetota bacterium]
MLTMRPGCELCDRGLPADVPGAWICSFECTFCDPCASARDHRCPNCGGELVRRPTREGEALRRHPASTDGVPPVSG